jgi:hypothetical protein
MPSSFEAPDLKKQLSVRVRASIHEKLADIRELWRAAAEVKGKNKETIEAIDLTHVVDTLLARVTDEELAQFGGFAETPEAKAAQVKTVRDAGSKPKKS